MWGTTCRVKDCPVPDHVKNTYKKTSIQGLESSLKSFTEFLYSIVTEFLSTQLVTLSNLSFRESTV